MICASKPTTGLETKFGIESFSDLDAALAQKPDITLVTNPTSRHLAGGVGGGARGQPFIY